MNYHHSQQVQHSWLWSRTGLAIAGGISWSWSCIPWCWAQAGGIAGHWAKPQRWLGGTISLFHRGRTPAPALSCTAGPHSHSWSVFTLLQRTQNGQKEPESGSASLLVAPNQAFSISNTFFPPTTTAEKQSEIHCKAHALSWRGWILQGSACCNKNWWKWIIREEWVAV